MAKLSKIGKRIIKLDKVNAVIEANKVILTAGGNTLSVDYDPKMLEIKNENGNLAVVIKHESKTAKALHGTVNSNLFNAVKGLNTPFVKKLNIVGVGYKAAVQGNKINLAMGYSHPVIFDIPKGLMVTTPTPVEIIISGYNKIIVGEFAANVRDVRGPEPYKGKGIAYSDEKIIRKVGKTAEGSKK
jgi:large subunit ribosomal protein L6